MCCVRLVKKRVLAVWDLDTEEKQIKKFRPKIKHVAHKTDQFFTQSE